ncbi:PH domain-containing protein [Patescibacteria group bacterium]|nr:PH domain-containing protein [Patescibacteria group bacterium]MBU1448767.1 PH domain-containing protein [Patescibacteria group bacterium]MBU2613399.1 PH domain-containing protein [Patescibacteria group bacterium]
MIDINHLPGGATGERTILVLRRHWITLFSLFVMFVAVVLLPIGTYIAIRYTSPAFFDDAARSVLFILGASIFFLYTWLFLYQHFLDYYLDTWIVTDDRILNIEQHGLFARTVSELRLHRVQDVTAEVKGFVRTVFDYGDVHIQTAGETQRFQFEEIPHPNAVAKMVMDLAEKERKEHLEEAVEEFGMPKKA